MWSAPVVTVGPVTAPVSLDEAKAQCRVTGTSHDASLNLYIPAAVALVQKWTGLWLAQQTVSISRANFEASMQLPVAPVRSVAALRYFDPTGDEQTVAADAYRLIGASTLSASIDLATGGQWPAVEPRADAITAEIVVGFDTVPADIKAALLLLISHLFDNRGVVASGSEMPWGVSDLLENHRTF